MEKNVIAISIVALIIGMGGGYALGINKAPQAPFINGHMMPNGTMMEGSVSENNMRGEMGSMMAGLQGKTGDIFDQEFLSEMILHHQGAVAMAQSALANAKHQEIKTMAQNIITAQNAEIKQMQDWQKAWYGK